MPSRVYCMFRSTLRTSAGKGWLLSEVLARKLLNSHGLYSSHTKHQFFFVMKRDFVNKCWIFLHPQPGCSENSPLHATKPRLHYTECPTRYRTRHFFNNFTTNEDSAKKFEADLPHCVRNVTTSKHVLFKLRCNIFIGVRIIKEMPGSVTSGTPCIKSED